MTWSTGQSTPVRQRCQHPGLRLPWPGHALRQRQTWPSAGPASLNCDSAQATHEIADATLHHFLRCRMCHCNVLSLLPSKAGLCKSAVFDGTLCQPMSYHLVPCQCGHARLVEGLLCQPWPHQQRHQQLSWPSVHLQTLSHTCALCSAHATTACKKD